MSRPEEMPPDLRRYRELATGIVRAHPELGSVRGRRARGMVERLALLIRARFGRPVLPKAGEIVAVTLDIPKTAALLFDRLWCPPVMDPMVPEELVVWGATETEIWPIVLMLALKPDWQKVQEVFGATAPISELWGPRSAPLERVTSEALARERGIKAIPIYESMGDWGQDYHPGTSEVIVAALHDLKVVDESNLTWDQVTDFRNDSAAKVKLRRLQHWVEWSVMDKSPAYVRDELAVRLDDYEWALKKHGIKTIIGTATELLDPRFLGGVGAATVGLTVAGADFWAVVGAAGALVGRIVLSVTTRLVELGDIRRGSCEVAFIHEAKKLGNAGKSGQ